MKCRNCNSEVKEGSLFCNNCGTDLKVNPPVDNTIKKDSSFGKKLLIILIIILGIGIIGTSTYFIYKNINKDNSGKTEEKDDTNKNSNNKKRKNSLTGEINYYSDVDIDKLLISYEDEISKNIKIEKMIFVPKKDSPGDLYVLAKNENNFPIKTSFTFDFLDKNDVRVDKKYGSTNVVSSGERFVISLTNLCSINDYVKQRLHVKVDKLRSYEHNLDLKLTDLTINEHDNQIDVSYNNTTNNNVEVFVSIIYYKNNEIHFMDSLSLNTKAGQEEKYNFYFSLLPDSTYNNPKTFDKYEIILSGAKYSDNTY